MEREQVSGGPLSDAQAAEFAANGVVMVPGFYDLRTDILPIQRAIHAIIGLVIAKHGVVIERPPFSPETFDSGYQAVLAHDRALGGEIYDAVKQIPAFVRLVAHPGHDAIFSQLRGTDLPGVAAGGYGIRIDNPFEEKYRANWHQEYPAQLRSLDGLVYWSPLVPITEEIGPVQIGLGSHREGVVPVYVSDPRNPDKSGAYALTLVDEEQRIARYPRASMISQPGDLVVMDFLTLHASGNNQSKRSRWSMQLRYFNFRNAEGIRIGWQGSFASGGDFRKHHPEFVVD
jgi:hypothetical protein